MPEHAPRPDRLAELAGALADGEAIDWAQASAGSAGTERAVLDELRWIAQISNVHASFDAAALHDSILHPMPAETLPPASDTPVEWGPLHVIEKVGRGTFGDVYRAHDRRLDRDVALKLLRRRAATDDGAGEAVIEEARVMARVRHPNIVAIYGADRIDDRVGLWMEFVHGRTLHEEVREQGPLDADDVARIGAALCDALAAMHAAGLVHRDVKAQNVMRDRDGRVLLTDFGTGREVSGDEARSADGELAGTPLYLAPEVLKGQAATASSDLYSVGVLLSYLATARFPVHGRSVRDIRDAHARGRAASVRSLRPALPAALAAAIDRALEPDPARRPASAEGFARALRAAPGAARRRVSRGLGAGVAAAVIAAGIWWWLAWAPGVSPAGSRGDARLRFQSQTFVLTDITADGRWAVGTDRAGETAASSVVLRDLTTGQVTPLVAGSTVADALSPVVSPDGRFVAFRFAPRVAGSEPNRPSSLKVIATTPNAQPTTVLPPDERLVLTPVAWSADGRSLLALARSRRRGTGAHVTRSLEWVSLDGGARRKVMDLDEAREIDEVRLSPDGQWIVYSAKGSDSGGRHIYVANADGTRETAVVRMAGVSSNPVWTADGTAVVFVSDRSGSRGLWSTSVRRDSRASEPALVKSGFAGKPIAVSQSGTLYYSESAEGEPLEFVVDRTTPGGRVVQSFIGEKGRYSRTGESVAFVRAGGPREIDVIVRSIRDGTERVFSREGLHFIPPLWLGHDDELLVHVAARGDEWLPGGAFYSLNLSTRMFTRRFAVNTPEFMRSVNGVVSPDGRTLYLLARRDRPNAFPDRVVAVDLDTGAEQRVLPLPPFSEAAGDILFDDSFALTGGGAGGGAGGLALSPDGSTLAVARWVSFRARQASLATLHVDGTGYREVHAPFEADYLGNIVDWGDATSIFVLTTDASGLARVMRVPAQGGPARFEGIDSRMLAAAVPSKRLVPRNGLTLDVSPDGSQLLIAVSTIATSEVWTMDDVLSRVRRDP